MRKRSKTDLIRAVAAARKPLVDSLESRVMFSVVPEGFAETLVAENVVSPTSMAFAPDGRLFVTEKGGDLKIIKNGSLLPTPFLTVDTSTFSERGLGGVAIDPNFDDNGFVYVYYTTPEPNAHNRLSRFTANGDVATAGSEQVLLDLPTPGNGTAHNGGAMKFLPDGTLLLGVGDHSYSLQAQSMDSLFGKILRLNTDGSIPLDNPFYDTASGINRAIWALGVRNPFTMDVQPGTGRVFINDVGNAAWEEINDGAPGANYGWVTTEGPFDPLQHPTFTEPFYYYDHSVGQAVTGGAFYNPAAVQFPAENVGKYFFADFAAGFIKRLNPVTKEVTDFVSAASGAVDLDVGPDGSLYWLSRFTNSVYKISATNAPGVSSHPQSQLISVGQPVTFTVGATGAIPITYQWQRDGQDIAGANDATYTIPATTLLDTGAQFRCVITNQHGSTMSDAATLTVTTDQPPTPTILTPAIGTTWGGGQNITFSGAGSDLEDGTIPAGNMTWWIDFHHDAHAHPFVAPVTGLGGEFEVPSLGETSANVWYRIHLSVTDSAGFTRETHRDIHPRTSTITVQANASGLALAIDGQPRTTPFTITGVEGMLRILSADEVQTVNGLGYNFVSWSNGGAAIQQIVFPENDTTYTANYSPYTDYWLTDRPWVSGTGLIPPVIDGNQWGETMILNGKAHTRGLGANTPAEFIYDIGGQGFQRFRATVGIDDVVGALGTAQFEVWVDGVRKLQTPVLTGADDGLDIDVDVAGGSTLRLVATDGGDGPGSDNIDWASARLVKFVHAVPDAPTALVANSPIYNRVNLSWDDNSTDEGAFYIERSTDGVNFTQIASVAAGTASFVDPYRAPGTTYHYRVRAHNTVGNSDYTTVASATTAASTLPAPWNETDVGDIAPSYSGSAAYDAGTGAFAVTGGGLAIGTEADAMHGVWRNLTGDGVITARLVSYSAETVFDIAQAGIFIRESMDPGSRAANFIATESANSVFFRRPITGGDSVAQFGPVLTRPHWLRLERSGEVFTASISTNGVDWIVYGVDTIPMNRQAVVGLAVSSNNAFGAVTATFDNVTVTSVAPYLVNAPSAAAAGATSATLTALGDDDGGESNLTYTWSTTAKPAGAPDPVFAAGNGVNAAKSLDVTFAKAGPYTFNVRISDGTRYADAAVTVTVGQTLSGVTVSPAALTMERNATHQFIAVGLDQFGDAMPSASLGELTWAVTRAGTISADGLYTAANANGTAVVRVFAGTYSAPANVTIVQPAPVVATPAAAAPAGNVTGTSAALSVLGESVIGEAALIYTWAAVSKPADANVSFSANGTNAAKNATVNFDRAGSYTFEVAIFDGTWTTTSQVVVTVVQSPTTLSVSPGFVPQLAPGGTQQFAADVLDQFDRPITGAEVEWSATGTGGAGGNSITTGGLFTAGTVMGEFVVTATAAGTPVPLSSSVDVTIDGVAPTVTWLGSPPPASTASEWLFQIRYSDALGVDVSTLGEDDVTVTAPGGQGFATELVALDAPGNGLERVATYQLTLTDSVFATAAPSGTWTVTLVGGSVGDVNDNVIPDAIDLGGFEMNGDFASVDPAGTLIVNGTFGADEMGLGIVGGQLVVDLNGQTASFDASGVTDVLIRGFHGDDTVTVAELGRPLRYVGGSGNDEIYVASGNVEVTQDLGESASGGDALVSVTVLDGASLTFSARQHLGALTLMGDAHVAMAGDPGQHILDIVYLTLSPTGTLDLGGQSLIVQSGAIGQADGLGGAYDGLTGLLASGFAGGAWDGPGITSSTAAARGDGVTGLGIGLAADMLGLPEGDSPGVWRGHAVLGNSVIVAYTYLGDANLDGFVSGDDYAAIDFNIAVPGSSGYARGDFNLDGVVSGDDYAAIDFNIVAQDAPLL